MEIPLEKVLAGGRTGPPYVRWPPQMPGNRLEPEAWPQLFPRFAIEPGARIFTIGSCFARDIEDHLHEQGFDVPMIEFQVRPGEYGDNRTSVLNRFTPTSIHHEIEWGSRIFERGGSPTTEQLTESLLDLPDGRCVDLHLGGLFPVSRDSAMQLRQDLGTVVAKSFTADVVIMTLGLIETWWDQDEARFIQKIPLDAMHQAFPGRFTVRRLSFDECLHRMRETLALLRAVGKPDKRFLVTTSPVPMFRTFTHEDVLVANTYSKALLRTVAGCLADENDDVDYFPSYESVTLSSNRADVWYEDQLHVRETFVAKIMQRAIASYTAGSVAAALTSAEQESLAGNDAGALATLQAVDPGQCNDDFERKLYHWTCLRALTALERVAETEPHLDAIASVGVSDSVEARHLARAWEDLGHPDRALQALEHLRIDGEVPAGVTALRAHLLVQLKRLPEALEEYRHAAATRPPTVGLHLKIGRLAANLGHLEEAESHFRAACLADPTHPKPIVWLVRVLLRQERATDALALAEGAAERDPQRPEFEELVRMVRSRQDGDSEHSSAQATTARRD